MSSGAAVDSLATAPAPPPLLEVRGVGCRFGGLKALDAVGFTVAEGEIFGLIGPNGAGKTTLFNVISGLTPASSGEVLWRGEAMGRTRPDRVNRLGIARTFQNLRLFDSLSALDNVRVGLHHADRHPLLPALLRRPSFRRHDADRHHRALELLALVDLAELAGQPAGTLSYGDRRRLEIARALATGPRLLLLDEPAAGMNPAEKDDLCELIDRIRARFSLTVLIIEHHVPLMMRLCDRLAVLNFGERIALGTPDQIRHDPLVIEAYLGRSSDASSQPAPTIAPDPPEVPR